jgi:hypothetical protein
VRASLGVRNSHSKQFRLSIVVGLRIFVCSNLSFAGDFNILLAKHSKNFLLKNAISIGIDEAQRGFEPMQIKVSAWKEIQVSDDQARLAIFKAFVEDELDAPKHLAREVWRNWREPAYEEFRPRTAYSLQNAFTSSFKMLDAVPLYPATADLGRFFQGGIVILRRPYHLLRLSWTVTAMLQFRATTKGDHFLNQWCRHHLRKY